MIETVTSCFPRSISVDIESAAFATPANDGYEIGLEFSTRNETLQSFTSRSSAYERAFARAFATAAARADAVAFA